VPASKHDEQLKCAAAAAVAVHAGKEALKSGLNIPGVAESYDEGGNLTSARWARGLKEGEQLPPSSW
jgi:hypothetical protein